MQFEMKVLRRGEGVSLLSVAAMNENDAATLAKNQGYTVLGIKSGGGIALPKFKRSGNGFPLVLFSQELLALLDAGLSLVEALETLAEKERHGEAKKIFDAIVARLYEGQPLSTALQDFPSVFPPLFVATIRTSEKTGGLSEALGRFVAYQSQLDFVRKKIISASIYPVLLMFVGGLVVMFLLTYIVPKFAVIYEGNATNLPVLSQLLLQWGTLLKTHGLLVLLAVLSVLSGGIYGITRPSVKVWVMQKLWHIPAVGERMHVYQLARFYRTLSMLLKGGIPVVSALEMVSGLLQPVLRAKLKLASRAISEGQTISHAMEAQELTTPVALRMLRVGERTGNVGEMMERIAAFYDEEMARWVDWFTKLFEPILMALIGLVIGVIVILMYMPVFDMAGNIQ
jgi:general secretion pathway protein F